MTIFDFFYFIYRIKDFMKKDRKDNEKIRVSVALDPNMISMIDDKTSNRSNLINWLLKEHFGNLGEDVSKIKL